MFFASYLISILFRMDHSALEWVLLYPLLCWAILAAFWDLRTHRLPVVLTVPAFPYAIVVASVFAPEHRNPLWGALLWGGLYLLVIGMGALHSTAQPGLGGGDLLLSLTTGCLAGVWGIGAVIAAIGLSASLTAIAAGGALLKGQWAGKRGSPNVAHGPAMLAGTATVWGSYGLIEHSVRPLSLVHLVLM